MARSLIWGLGGTSMAAAASVAGYIVLNTPDEPAGETPPEVQPLALVDGDAVTAADPVGAQTVPPEDPAVVLEEEAAAPSLPTFDVVRVARDGNALVAGQASPGAQVELRVDNEIVAQSVADASGQFVAMFDLGHSDAAQMMTLSMQPNGEAAVVSPDQVILTPRPAEVAVASPEPETVVEAEGEVEAVELALLEDSSVPEVDIVSSEDAELVEDIAPEADTSPSVEIASDAPSETTPEAPLQVAAETVVEHMPDSAAEVAAQVVEGVSPAVEAVAEVTQEAVTQVTEPELDVSLAATEPSEPPQDTTQDPVQVTEPQVARADTDVQTEIAQAPQPETQSEAEPALEQVEIAQEEPVAEMPTALLVRGTGEVELLDRAPQVMDNVVIDTISYTAVGDVQIAGRASGEAPQANLRIYLNNMPIAVARSTGGDWASDLPDVDPGVYTLRVDQLNDTGGVVSRFETPFQREDPERVVAAQARAAGQANVETAPANAAPPASQRDEVAAQTVAQAPEPAATPSVAAEVDVVTSEQTEQTEQSTPVMGLAEATQSQPTPSTPDIEIAEVETASAETAPVETVAVEAVAVETGSAEVELPSEPVPAETAAVEVAQVAPEPAISEPVTPEPPISLVTVQPGATLWAISRERYGAGELYVQIYRANRSQIRNPDLIYPGQIFSLPD